MLRLMSIVTLGLMLLISSAHAQRNLDWVLLGERTVNFRTDRDIINVNQTEEWFSNRIFRTLYLVVERNEVYVSSIRVTYINGYREDFRVDSLIREGDRFPIDLTGERSYIRQIELLYRARPNFRGDALIRVYGELSRSGQTETARWNELDVQRLNMPEGQVTLRVNRGFDRLDQILIRALNERIYLYEAQIKSRNNEKKLVVFEQFLGAGAETPSINLEGKQREVSEVIVYFRPSPRQNEAALALLGIDRSNLPSGDTGLILLGQRTVGFTTDRDVIDVSQSEDWFTNRVFRTLFFRAERNDIYMISVRIVYINGYSEDLSLEQLIRDGAQLPLDLGGERSYLRRIEMLYRSRPGYRGEALIKVLGEPVRQ